MTSTIGARLGGKFAFIGLGRMGLPIARNLHRGLSPEAELRLYDLKGVDRSIFPQGNDDAKVVVCRDVQEAVDDVSTILTALPNDPALLATLTPSTPLKMATDSLVLDLTTTAPRTSRHLAKTLSTTYIDTPMSGGVPAATAGTLTFLIGLPATSPLAPRVTQVLSTVGKNITFCGALGLGAACKLANNYILAAANLAAADAFYMAKTMGMSDGKLLRELIATSTGRCWPVDVNNPVPGVVPTAPASKGYEGGFALRLMRKDLELVAEESKGLLLGDRLREVYRVMEEKGEGGRDFSVVYETLDKGGRF